VLSVALNERSAAQHRLVRKRRSRARGRQHHRIPNGAVNPQPGAAKTRRAAPLRDRRSGQAPEGGERRARDAGGALVEAVGGD
jgi:hypothetical protein